MIAKAVRIVLVSAAAATLISAFDAAAQTTFSVTASVAKNCRITAAADISITNGTAWDPTSGANPTNTGIITVRCTRGTPYTIDVNGGAYSDQMTHTNGVDTLPYKLYAADCSTAFTPIAFTATSSAARNHTLCAGLDVTNPAIDPIAGDYSDSVVVDVTF